MVVPAPCGLTASGCAPVGTFVPGAGFELDGPVWASQLAVGGPAPCACPAGWAATSAAGGLVSLEAEGGHDEADHPGETAAQPAGGPGLRTGATLCGEASALGLGHEPTPTLPGEVVRCLGPEHGWTLRSNLDRICPGRPERMSAMGSPAERILDLLSLFESRPRWQAAELADRLDVTERTVRRDVTRLRDLGYPVEAEAGPAGGYRLGAGRSLPPLLLADDEAVAVALGLRLATRYGLTGVDDATIAALAKLDQVLPSRLRERITAVTSSTVFVARPASGRVSPDLLLVLAQGCRDLERVRFRYRAGNGAESERRVEPYRLVSATGRWYLVAFDLDRAAWRTFRVDRMSDVVPSGHRFVRREEPDAATMVAEGIAIGAYERQAEVLLRATLDECAELVPSTIGTLEDAGHGTMLRLGFDDLDWIARYLASLPVPCEVRQPPDLRAALRSLGQRLVREHRG